MAKTAEGAKLPNRLAQSQVGKVGAKGQRVETGCQSFYLCREDEKMARDGPSLVSPRSQPDIPPPRSGRRGRGPRGSPSPLRGLVHSTRLPWGRRYRSLAAPVPSAGIQECPCAQDAAEDVSVRGASTESATQSPVVRVTFLAFPTFHNSPPTPNPVCQLNSTTSVSCPRRLLAKSHVSSLSDDRVSWLIAVGL